MVNIKQNATETYCGLRDHILRLRLEESPFVNQAVIAVLFETFRPKAVVTLALVADGTASLYFSSGGGIIGAGQHPSVRQASTALLQNAAAIASELTQTQEFPTPRFGYVRFYVVATDAVRTTEALEEELVNNRHQYSQTFHLAHAVIAAIRESEKSV